jgi:hypothetical protein
MRWCGMWYFVKDGQPFGPVETEALNESFSRGSLRPIDLVWQPGMATWAPASTVAELWSEPCAPPLLRGLETDELASHADYARVLLKVCGSICMIALVCSLYFLASRYWGEIDLSVQVKQADVFVRHPEKPMERLE